MIAIIVGVIFVTVGGGTASGPSYSVSSIDRDRIDELINVQGSNYRRCLANEALGMFKTDTGDGPGVPDNLGKQEQAIENDTVDIEGPVKAYRVQLFGADSASKYAMHAFALDCSNRFSQATDDPSPGDYPSAPYGPTPDYSITH